jgi:regulator of replication initiation timing
MSRYKRDNLNSAVLLIDQRVVDEYKQKKSVESEVQSLREEINILKTEMESLKSLLTKPSN